MSQKSFRNFSALFLIIILPALANIFAQKKAPAFSLQDLAGRTVGLVDFQGKPLVVNFFFSGTCDWTGGLLQKLYDEYSSKGLRVIGINLYDKEVDIRSCLDKYQVKYPVLKADQKTQTAGPCTWKVEAGKLVVADAAEKVLIDLNQGELE